MPVSIEVGGHATVLVRACGFTLLCDPHFGDSYRGGLLGFAPARRISPRRIPHPDAVWISHSHRDHFDVVSLDALDRALPVLHPDDLRIAHTLHQLGFTDTTVVRDWTTLTPRPGLELVWTPSTFAGPEHGLAVRTTDAFVWHMVDSLVTPAWVDRLLGSGRSPDLILTPCQPVLETHGVDGVPPGVDPDWEQPLAALLTRARPAHVVPLPEGQYGLGDAAWLNGHKFPIPPAAVDRVLLADAPGRQVLRADPGDRIVVGPGAAVRLEGGAAAWVRVSAQPRDRTFRPGHWTGSLTSGPGPVGTAAPVDGLDRLFTLSPVGAGAAVPGLAELVTDAGQLRATSYRFILVGPGGVAAAERSVRLRSDGTLAAEPPAGAPDIEVAVTASDLDDLLAARLGYSAAQYGGRLREVRPGLAVDPEPGPVVVASRHDRPPAGRVAVLSGIGLFSLLLRARLGSAVAELDSEIAACQQRRPLRPRAAARARVVRRIPEFRPAAGPELGPIWSRISRCLASGDDPATASGTVVHGPRRDYVGVLGRAGWPEPTAEPDNGTGLLLLTCMVEAQPHLGGGVRFPNASYRALLANVEASPIRRWRLAAVLPAGLTVPRWRAASLFPVSADRLRLDLERRGWDGELLASGEEPASRRDRSPRARNPTVEQHWWLGVPQPRGPSRSRRIIHVTDAPGYRLSGLVEESAQALGRPAPGTGPTWPGPGTGPDFRMWAAAGPDSRSDPDTPVFPLRALLRGDVRFSWLLPPAETTARAGRPVDATAFAERVALLALAELTAHGPAAPDAEQRPQGRSSHPPNADRSPGQ
jgi:L-ascorbate metabolism protein UlaG (beta-lactamase superfamily)